MTRAVSARITSVMAQRRHKRVAQASCLHRDRVSCGLEACLAEQRVVSQKSRGDVRRYPFVVPWGLILSLKGLRESRRGQVLA